MSQALVGTERRFCPQQRIGGDNEAGVTLESVTSYIGASVGAMVRSMVR